MLVVITASPYQPDSLRSIPIPPIVPARFPSCCSTLQQSGHLPALVLRAKRASGRQALTCVRTAREAPGARVTAALITSSPDAGAQRRQRQAAAQACRLPGAVERHSFAPFRHALSLSRATFGCTASIATTCIKRPSMRKARGSPARYHSSQ